MSALKTNEALEALAEQLNDWVRGEVRCYEEGVLADPDYYDYYFCDDADTADVREAVQRHLIDWAEGHKDIVLFGQDISDDIVTDLIHGADIVMGQGYYSGGYFPISSVPLYGRECELHPETPAPVYKALQALSRDDLTELLALVSTDASFYVEDCIKAYDRGTELPEEARAYAYYPGTPTLTLTEEQVERAVAEALVEISRPKGTAEIARAWRARNDRFAIIDGGKEYSLRELMKFRAARRKRLGLKHQNKRRR